MNSTGKVPLVTSSLWLICLPLQKKFRNFPSTLLCIGSCLLAIALYLLYYEHERILHESERVHFWYRRSNFWFLHLWKHDRPLELEAHNHKDAKTNSTVRLRGPLRTSEWIFPFLWYCYSRVMQLPSLKADDKLCYATAGTWKCLLLHHHYHCSVFRFTITSPTKPSPLPS